MASPKKKSRSLTPKKTSVAARLANRVKQLETDMKNMRATMTDLGEDLSALRTTVRHVDERSIRGETVMMSMQMEQHRMSKVMDLVAVKLGVEPPAPVPAKDEDDLEEDFEDDDLEKEA